MYSAPTPVSPGSTRGSLADTTHRSKREQAPGRARGYGCLLVAGIFQALDQQLQLRFAEGAHVVDAVAGAGFDEAGL